MTKTIRELSQSNTKMADIGLEDLTMWPNQSPEPRRWRCQFRCRGSRRESAVAQLTSEVIRQRIF